MATQIFVNLPVKDLNKSIEFFTRLGYKFNPQFTNDKATCMILSEDIFVMLLVEEFFKTFTKKQICDTTISTEAILALSADSKTQVDDLIEKAVKAGGISPKEIQDEGWMYSRSYQDLDGHLWEILYMDPSAIPQNQTADANMAV